MRSRLEGGWLIVAVFCVVSMSAYVSHRRRLAAADRRIAELSASVERLEARPVEARLVRERTIVERVERRAPAAADLAGPPAPTQAPGESELRPLDPGPRKPGDERVTRQFEDRFSAEAVDGGWAASQSEALSRRFRETGQTTAELGAVECRSKTCRLEADFASIEAQNTFFDGLFGADTALRFGQVVAPSVDVADAGRRHVVLFVTREGT